MSESAMMPQPEPRKSSQQQAHWEIPSIPCEADHQVRNAYEKYLVATSHLADELHWENEVAYGMRQLSSPGSDHVPGELLMFVAQGDTHGSDILNGIRDQRFADVRHLESLEDVLARADLIPRKDMKFDLHVLSVPPGAETVMSRRLEFEYRQAGGRIETGRAADLNFAVVPHPILRSSAPATDLHRPSAPAGVVRARDIRLSSHHHSYLAMVCADSAPQPAEIPCILLLDSGLALDVPFPVEDRRNLLNDSEPYALDDYHHGTAIAMLANAILPSARIKVAKIMDASGQVRVIDLVAPLWAEQMEADVISMSVAFRPKRRATRLLLQRVVSERAVSSDAPILVASAGNESKDSFCLPAGIPNVVAIGSICSNRLRSSFSNYGGRDVSQRVHPHYYVMPGGEKQLGRREAVADFRGRALWGTSYATVYATAALAWQKATRGLHLSAHDVLAQAQHTSDRNIPGFSYAEHGHGILTFRI